MEVKINKLNTVKEIITKDIKFPYYAWYSGKKVLIVKIDVKYFDYDIKSNDVLRYVSCTFITNGFGFSPSIRTKKITVYDNNVIDNDINETLRDYTDIATEQEYVDFLNETFEAIKNI